MAYNPYAPPNAEVSDITQLDAAPPLWTPNAAANWSLLFSPAFGSFVQMLNWEALGEVERAAVSRRWFVASVAVLIGTVAAALFLENDRRVEIGTRLAGLVYLFTWYFSSGRAQAKYVEQRFGAHYPRRRWWKPLIIAIAATAGYVLLAAVAAYLIGDTGIG
jgi:hypothetical protein